MLTRPASKVSKLRKKGQTRSSSWIVLPDNSVASNTQSTTTSCSTSLHYDPLDYAHPWIRLVTLEPALDFFDDICCDIYPVSLDSTPEYEALSYTWGSTNITETIYVRNRPFKATINLVSALRHLRLKDVARTMWVDAICIDQSNIYERGHQVALMTKIYSLAKCDLLWIGDDYAAGYVFKIVEETAEKFHSELEKDSFDLQELEHGITSLAKTETLSMLRTVLSDPPVWNRIWVVQEIATAQRIDLHCGFRSMPWTTLGQFFDVVEFCPPIIESPAFYVMAACSGARAMNNVRDRNFSLDNNRTFLELWNHFSSLEATDPRDKVFALLGLVTGDPLDITPDYSKSAEELFSTIVRMAISRTQNLASLTFGHKTRQYYNKSTNLNLPTWVPDFAADDVRFSLWKVTEYKDVPYSASGKISSPKVPWGKLAVDPAVLTLPGVFLDVVLTTFKPIDFEWSPDQYMAMVKRLPIPYMSRSYWTGESGFNALARTLVADHAEGFQRRLDHNGINKFTKMLLWLVAFRRHLSTTSRTLTEASADPIGNDYKTAKEGYEAFFNSMRFLGGYRFCVTANGFMAMIPDIAKEGDRIFILYGSKVPHVLRPVLENSFQLIGDAYVHGFMDGQAIEWRDQGKLEERVVNLI